jgi:hypothetical protein
MRYFFDVLSDSHEFIDEEGCELQSDAQMQLEATRLLAGIASDEALYGGGPPLVTRVRDMNGTAIYRAILTIEGQRLQ